MPFGSFGRKHSIPHAIADGWQRAGDGLASGLLTKGGADPDSIGVSEAALGCSLPPSLASFIEQADAAEGWIGGEYFAMWPVAEIPSLNRLARVADVAPRLVAFATNGGLDGYLFDRETGAFLTSPMIGLGYVDAAIVAPTFDELLAWIAAQNPAPADPPVADPSTFGQVIHEIKPILFGGSPADPDNKVLLPLAKYAEVVAWWNGQLQSANAPSLGQQEA